ncbi:MAG: response regulator [Patescibacteria group bacterium]|nr:response regulator [Patescibacteria group bacterium]
MKNKKIMIVEDDRFLLKAYEIKFQQLNFDVVVAMNGNEGLKLAEKEVPSLILLDLMLPKMNGFEFLKKIKSDERLKEIPIIAVSNLGQKSDKDKALSLGAKEYLIKTDFTLEEIGEKIKKYI